MRIMLGLIGHFQFSFSPTHNRPHNNQLLHTYFAICNNEALTWLAIS